MDAAARRRHELYERAAQSPGRLARFLQSVAGPGARRLGEDFCGSGALSLEWARLGVTHRATAVDHDAELIGWLRERAAAAGVGDRVTAFHGDVLEAVDGADVIAALNFSVGYFHDRSGLLGYLSRARERLADGGAFVCDLYGGIGQYELGETVVDLGGGETYTWEQRSADPLSGRVVNAMHFTLSDGERWRDAFVYDWRLWGPPELSDALVEAGFRSVEWHDRLGEGLLDDGSVLTRATRGEDLEDEYVLYAVARA